MDWAVAFLGVIAASSAVQAVFLIGLARGGRKLARRLDDLNNRIDREIRPTLDNLTRVTRNLAEVSDLAVLQARRIDLLVEDTVIKVEETTDTLRRLVARPLRPLANVLAFLRAVRRAVGVYRRLGGLAKQAEGRNRQYRDDEHLFI